MVIILRNPERFFFVCVFWFGFFFSDIFLNFGHFFKKTAPVGNKILYLYLKNWHVSQLTKMLII